MAISETVYGVMLRGSDQWYRSPNEYVDYPEAARLFRYEDEAEEVCLTLQWSSRVVPVERYRDDFDADPECRYCPGPHTVGEHYGSLGDPLGLL